MNEKVVVIGAGGHGRVVAEIVRLCGDEFVGFLDENTSLDGVVGTPSDIEKFGDCRFTVAIGNAAVRMKYMQMPLDFYTAVHPRAVVSPDAVIGEGTVVVAGAVINCGAKIGRGVIINTLSCVDHDCTVGDFCHICPGAHLAGTVRLGSRCMVGAGAAVINNINICDGVTVGAGGAVVGDIIESGVYAGVPAKKIK